MEHCVSALDFGSMIFASRGCTIAIGERISMSAVKRAITFRNELRLLCGYAVRSSISPSSVYMPRSDARFVCASWIGSIRYMVNLSRSCNSIFINESGVTNSINTRRHINHIFLHVLSDEYESEYDDTSNMFHCTPLIDNAVHGCGQLGTCSA